MTQTTQKRMETLQKAGVNTQNFLNLHLKVPTGAKIEIKVNDENYFISDGKLHKNKNSVLCEEKDSAKDEDSVVSNILENGYVFNSRTDGKWVVAQTFNMLNFPSYNYSKRETERPDWNAYLRNNYSYMYQFSMMKDELKKLAKMQKDGDPEFYKLSSFFTKKVVVDTCEHYVKQLRKYIKNKPEKHCKGEPYIHLPKYGDVFTKDLPERVYIHLTVWLNNLKYCEDNNYAEIKAAYAMFYKNLIRLPFDTPKCPAWKEAFKGKGAYVTLLNLIKFHDVLVQDYETKAIYNRDQSVRYVESLLVTYRGSYWKFHSLLKRTIEFNDFDFNRSLRKAR